ncbi:MAG: TIGR00159 family protein [Bacteroidetes bacterium CG2_30_33_31]|nr:MAG: TIGR00159 family protein [Bacteroidetes bacterium CG2_30_33_31]
MENLIPLFIHVKITDIIDILLVAYLLYAIFKLIKGSVAINIFTGLFLIFFVWKIVEFMEMRMLSEILNQFVNVGALALIIVFQPEIRKFLIHLGTSASSGINHSKKTRFFSNPFKSISFEVNIDEIVKACKNMSTNLTGAIIIITRNNRLQEEVKTGEIIDANISSSLIESIFYKNNPLHDGALIITDNKIAAARCVVKITEKTSFPSQYGLRHRAGLGITEQTDAFVIIVSEQTGKIAIADEGEVKFNVSLIDLKRTLLLEFNSSEN